MGHIKGQRHKQSQSVKEQNWHQFILRMTHICVRCQFQILTHHCTNHPSDERKHHMTTNSESTCPTSRRISAVSSVGEHHHISNTLSCSWRLSLEYSSNGDIAHDTSYTCKKHTEVHGEVLRYLKQTGVLETKPSGQRLFMSTTTGVEEL